jgi:capsular polysaccharide transport system permease protein
MTSVTKRGPWIIWKDVIFALFAREIRTGFSDKLGISWAVVQPVLFIFVLSFFRGRLDGGDTHSIPTFVFMAFGMIQIQAFLQTFTTTSASVKKNKSLYAFRQVQPISSVVAKGLFELLVKIFVVLGIVLTMYLINMEYQIANPLAIILYFIGLWVFAVSMGLIFGLLSLYVPEITKIQMLFSRPLFFISGVFFSLQDFPKEYWWLLNWNPILHAIELSRYAAYPSYGNAGVSQNFFFMVVLSTLFLALTLYHGYWKQAINR